MACFCPISPAISGSPNLDTRSVPVFIMTWVVARLAAFLMPRTGGVSHFLGFPWRNPVPRMEPVPAHDMLACITLSGYQSGNSDSWDEVGASSVGE